MPNRGKQNGLKPTFAPNLVPSFKKFGVLLLLLCHGIFDFIIHLNASYFISEFNIMTKLCICEDVESLYNIYRNGT